MTIKFARMLDGFHDRLHQSVLIAFSMILALVCAVGVIWDPVIISEKIGGFTVLSGIALIWATCTGFIHGIGFKPHFWLWQIVFFPPLAWLIMLVVLIRTFI